MNEETALKSFEYLEGVFGCHGLCGSGADRLLPGHAGPTGQPGVHGAPLLGEYGAHRLQHCDGLGQREGPVDGASRALMVISLVLSTLGLVIAVLGMQCTVCLEGSGELKKRVAGVGGCFFLSAGFMTLVPVSCTTNKVIQNFYSPTVPATLKFELGDCLYLGMVSALLSMLGGGMLAVSLCEGKEGGGNRRRRYGGGGYPYPVGSGGVPVVRNPTTLQMGGISANSRGQTLIRSGSGSSGGVHVKPVAAGYDVTGYV
ncbi:claudin-2 isoform X2 [Phyllopteryx taeniolatus]|uniref:claudin-2 isoform X2 n=1 Tax=Phyllopteryx taeniolatus TaxID=161469 RepID=UPI002AD4F87D|nr:claudin-2 isoform X2 [Phyllopteryx taeniolatus]